MNLYESISWKSIAQPKWEKEGEIIIHISFGQHPTFLQIELDLRPPSDRGLSKYSIQTILLLLFTIHVKDLIDTKLFSDRGTQLFSLIYLLQKYKTVIY